MKKFIATSFAFVMLLASLGETTSAATKKSIFNRPMNLGCSVKYDMPSFSQASNSDENMSVFYSTQGKLTLQNPEGLTKNSYVSVNIAQPRKERKLVKCFWLGKGNVDPGENRFQLRVSDDKAQWWNLIKRAWNWICEKLGYSNGVYVKYALVLTSKDDEKILETPEVKEGQKKKEVLDAEKFRKEVEKYYGKDKVTEFKETYISKLLDGIKSDPNLDPYDPFNVAEAGHLDTLQAALPAMDRNSYYTKKEADEVNKKIREDKAKVLAKLAQKCGDELITKGEVAKLSPINKEQTFRLIINNNIGEGGEADKIVLLLSNLVATGQSIEDDSKINFASYVASTLPDRFTNPLTEAERNSVNRAYKTLYDAKRKLGFTEWLLSVLKKIDFTDIIKDLIWWKWYKAPEEQQQLAQQTQLAQDQQKVQAERDNLQKEQKQLQIDREQLQQEQRDQAQRAQQAMINQQQNYINQQRELMTQRQQMLNQQALNGAARGAAPAAQPAPPINVTVNPTINPNFNTQHNEGNGINGLAANARPAPAGAPGVAAPAAAPAGH